MKCKTCGLNSHYCTNCDPDKYLDQGFCSKECYKKHPDTMKKEGIVISFYNNLTQTQRTWFRDVLDMYESDDMLEVLDDYVKIE